MISRRHPEALPGLILDRKYLLRPATPHVPVGKYLPQVSCANNPLETIEIRKGEPRVAYFPLFVELEEKPCLIVGGGTVALRKAEKLLSYGARLTAVAPTFAPGWEALSGPRPGAPSGCVAFLRRAFCPSDIDGQTLVIAATDDALVNAAVAAQCRAARIPVNAVDDPANCTFLFPALVRRGALSVGISTGGASPTAAATVRRRIESVLPEGGAWGAILDFLAAQRPRIKSCVPDEKVRAKIFAALFEACMARGGPLEEKEVQAILHPLIESELS